MQRIALLAGAAFAVAASGAAMAAPITSSVTTQPGATYNAAALTGFATTGADMGGIKVTVLFSGGGTATALWNAGTESATGTGWSLSQPENTFGNPWTLSNTSASTIVGFVINGAPGNTTFDIISNPETSPGSASGDDFGVADASNASEITAANATYKNQLRIGGTFYGDLYETLSVSFAGTGLTAGNTFRFEADTDNARADLGGITEVPEPASLALFGLGLAGLGLIRRRR